MRHYWADTTWATVELALTRVRSGHPTVLLVEGEPGMGKSSLCSDLLASVSDFVVFSAEGVEGHDSPYGVLDQWGVHVPRTAEGAQVQPFAAAQVLRELTDAAGGVAPSTLLLVDDAQWADVESLDAVSWLARRALGDRLLVVLASRPAPDRRREGWRRWLDGTDMVLRVALGGLAWDEARLVIADQRADLPQSVAERLWLHTLGNPLYLGALLTEAGETGPIDAERLPAPAEYARHVAGLLAQQPRDARLVAEALAVLGPGRFELSDVAALAEVDDAAAAARLLAAAGLVDLDQAGQATGVRWVHGLAARAVHQIIDPPHRRGLHRRGATLATSEAAAFEHRLAAVEGADPILARDLVQAAGRLYDAHSYRVAARYLRSAAGLSDADERGRLRLDAAFCAVLAKDGVDPRDDLQAAGDTEPVRRSLVLGAWQCFSGRYREGAAVFAEAADRPVDASDPVPRHRLEMLLAWARTLLDHDVDLIAAGLQRGLSLDVADPAMTSYRLLAQGHVSVRTGRWAEFVRVLEQLPDSPSATPPRLSGLLVWRSSVEIAEGRLGHAVADLRELQRRQHDGVVDVLSNGFDSLLAALYWVTGRPDLATVTFRGAREARDELVGLITHALSSLPWSTSGEFAEADRQLAEGATVLDDRPWSDAVAMFVVAQVVRRHAGGSPAAQATLLAETRQRWPHANLDTGTVYGWWRLHFALAHLWAGELDLAEGQVRRMGTFESGSETLRAAISWVSGLLAERRGQTTCALDLLRAAAAVTGTEVPLYRAHTLADHARLARAAGAHAEAARSEQQARAIYTELQAAPYLTRLPEASSEPVPTATAATAATAGAPDYVLPLTEREYDVVTLVIAGYSYAQISRELYVSQSTVSYHLGNVYPKANVRSRHELTDWVRRHPGSVVAPAATS